MSKKKAFAAIEDEWNGLREKIEELVEIVNASPELPQIIVEKVRGIGGRVSPVATAIKGFKKKT